MTNAPLHPIGVCTAHSHEQTLDGLSLYSTKFECNSGGWVDQLEWNNTECDSAPYNIQPFRKEDGWFFNCGDESLPNCPFTVMKFWEKRELNMTVDFSGHDEHLCLFDMKKFHEIALVTNICIDMMEEYNISVYLDCTARKVSYTEYNDSECTVRSEANDYFEINEGCDDPYDLNAYFQVAECEDANIVQHMPTVSPSASSYQTTTADAVVQSPSYSKPTVVIPSTANTSDDGPQDVVTMIIGVIAVILLAVIVVMAFILCQRKQARQQVVAANVDEQPFNVDFQSIEPEPINAYGQQVTTQGQDIEEIQISQ
eukprot:CAMPEP_0202702028 /NCGR_PEP_ID=MMETSP1385-20130828/15066_1 /ASSEMBLY_ACC=CAM_ASM_000861 /TAXON_ID=933848 /ORGANISM="Elphidium margaritaceum" /LENGTH=312 /DNA_ID=CAMNT_0049359585 /DNA_START=135 /DNA_END=1073 /DNA_ORIENTATION=-